MSQDQHFNVPDPEAPEVLRDRKGTDMPAARTILVVILATITAVVLFLSIRFVILDVGSRGDAAPRQERIQ
jgi:hypothetical protein